MSVFDEPEICRSILDSLPTGLCVVDLQKKIVFWSDAAERITGHRRHEVIGRSCIAEPLLHCDQPGCEFCSEDCPVARAIKTSRPAEISGTLHHKAGHDVPVHIRAVPVRNAHGSIIGAVETFEKLAAHPDRIEYCPALPGCVDEVTGLASHARMQSHLREALGVLFEAQVPFCILCIRLEGMQHFRANFGVEAASSLLTVIARTLEHALWKSDFVGRWAHDQFLAILNGCREEALGAVRERIRRMLVNNAIEWWGERHSLPVSIGVAAAQPDDTIELLMERAQESLDAASAWRVRASEAGANPAPGS